MTQNTKQKVRTREEHIEKMVDVMQDYRLLHTKEENNEPVGYPLIDALTYDGGTVDIGIEECGELAAELYDSTIASLILEAEARGAAEQRRKDAEENGLPSAWVRPNDFYNDEGDERFGPWSSEQSGEYTLSLYTHPANVAALEARVKEMEGENNHQRTQILELRNDDRRIRLAAERVCSVRESSEIFHARIALRAALKREGDPA